MWLAGDKHSVGFFPCEVCCVGCVLFTVPLRGFGRVFGMNRCPFWNERGRVGGFPGFLSSAGAFFIGGCMTPPPPSDSFSGNGLCFYLASDREGLFSGFFYRLTYL